MSERERSRSAEVRSSERPSSGYPIGRPKHQAREGCTVDNLVSGARRKEPKPKPRGACSQRSSHPSIQPASHTDSHTVSQAASSSSRRSRSSRSRSSRSSRPFFNWRWKSRSTTASLSLRNPASPLSFRCSSLHSKKLQVEPN